MNYNVSLENGRLKFEADVSDYEKAGADSNLDFGDLYVELEKGSLVPGDAAVAVTISVLWKEQLDED